MKYRNSTSNRTTASAHPKRHNRRQPTFPTPPPSPSLLSPRLLISSLFLSLFSFSSYYYLYLTLPYFTLLYLSLPYFISSLSFSLSLSLFPLFLPLAYDTLSLTHAHVPQLIGVAPRSSATSHLRRPSKSTQQIQEHCT